MTYQRTQFTTIPGLGLKGKDIRQRLRNGTITPKAPNYPDGYEDAINEFLLKDKPGRIMAAAELAEKTKSIKSKLQNPKQ